MKDTKLIIGCLLTAVGITFSLLPHEIHHLITFGINTPHFLHFVAGFIIIGVGLFFISKSIKMTKLYKCNICGFSYKEKKWMLKCMEWCKKHKSCNLEITKHAVKN